jgi:hypothetical protein
MGLYKQMPNDKGFYKNLIEIEMIMIVDLSLQEFRFEIVNDKV